MNDDDEDDHKFIKYSTSSTKKVLYIYQRFNYLYAFSARHLYIIQLRLYSALFLRLLGQKKEVALNSGKSFPGAKMTRPNTTSNLGYFEVYV